MVMSEKEKLRRSFIVWSRRMDMVLTEDVLEKATNASLSLYPKYNHTDALVVLVQKKYELTYHKSLFVARSVRALADGCAISVWEAMERVFQRMLTLPSECDMVTDEDLYDIINELDTVRLNEYVNKKQDETTRETIARRVIHLRNYL